MKTKKFLWGSAIIIIIAILLSVLTGNKEIIFTIFFVSLVEFFLYQGSKKLSKFDLLYWPEKIIAYSSMWGILFFLVREVIGDKDLLYYIFAIPLVVALLIFLCGIFYEGVKRVEDACLR